MTEIVHEKSTFRTRDENGASQTIGDEEYFYCDGELDRKDGPAVILHDYVFGIMEEYYYRHGKLDRENGPAVVKHNHLLRTTEEMYYRDGKLDRKNGPAVIKHNADGSTEEEYYRDGGLHRKNGPQIVKRYADGSTEERYCEDGEDRQHKGFLDRKNGPALIRRNADGTIKEEMYFHGGVPCHAELGPAVIKHNADGSTVREYCEDGITVKTEHLNSEGLVVKTEQIPGAEKYFINKSAASRANAALAAMAGPNRYAELKKATPHSATASTPRAPPKPRAPGMAP